MVRLCLFSVILLSSSTLGVRAQFDPYSSGPHQTTSFNIKWMTTIGLQQDLDVWSPVETGTYPLLYFLDAFGAVTPGDAYDDTMFHVASHGFVVVNSRRIIGSLHYADKVAEFADTVEWSKDHLENNLHEEGVSADLTIDFNLTFGMGHSAGAHVLVDYLKSGCNDFKGIILSSPVDGAESQQVAITDGTLLNFQVPSIVLPAGLDNVPGGSSIPCAPAAISNLHFYDALDPGSPRWMVNATEYGHGDYMDQPYVDLIIESHFCAVKQNGTIQDFVLYRNFFSGQVVSFLKSLIEDDCETYLTFIEDLSATPVLTSGEHVNPAGGCPRPYCKWNPI